MSSAKTVQIRIPVAVREDGSVFVWEQDTSAGDGQPGIPRAFEDCPANRLFYVDLDGKKGREGQRHGNHAVHYIVADVPVPKSCDAFVVGDVVGTEPDLEQRRRLA